MKLNEIRLLQRVAGLSLRDRVWLFVRDSEYSQLLLHIEMSQFEVVRLLDNSQVSYSAHEMLGGLHFRAGLETSQRPPG